MDEAPIYAGPPPAAGAAFADNLKGFILAVASSAFIGASFIIKKKGLKRAGAVGFRAEERALLVILRVGGYGYLLESLRGIGMVTMIIGEIANVVAYIICSSCSCYSIGCFEHHRECRFGPFHFEREARRWVFWAACMDICYSGYFLHRSSVELLEQGTISICCKGASINRGSTEAQPRHSS